MSRYSKKDDIELVKLLMEAVAPANNVIFTEIDSGMGGTAKLYQVMINNIFSGVFWLNPTGTVIFYNSDMKNKVSQNVPYAEVAETFKPQLDPLNGQQFRDIGLDGFKQKIESLLNGGGASQAPQAPQQPTQPPQAPQAPPQPNKAPTSGAGTPFPQYRQ